MKHYIMYHGLKVLSFKILGHSLLLKYIIKWEMFTHTINDTLYRATGVGTAQ